MSIKLNNFVNVNIDYVSSLTSSGIRDVVVLLDDSTNRDSRFDSPATFAVTPSDAYWANIDDYVSDGGVVGDALYATVECFFKNGGQKIHYLRTTNVTTTLEALPNNEIVITSTMPISVSEGTGLIDVCTTYNATHSGVEEKLFISSIGSGAASGSAVSTLQNFAIKVGNPGCEMTIAAYLSNIDIDSPNSLQDYCFTREVLNAHLKPSVPGEYYPECIVVLTDDSVFKAIKGFNCYNCDIKLGNSGSNVETLMTEIRNYGGNTCGQIDLVNYFTKIVFTQTVTSALINVLASKIKYNNEGLGDISSAILNEIYRYDSFGYLSYDKVWKGGDQIVRANDNDYLVIANNTALLNGYYLTILPLESLTDAQKANHLLPGIYIYLADNYSVRQISITGKVF